MNTLSIKTPLERIGNKSKIVNQFQYIYFKNGYVYSTNGNVHIKQHMRLHGMGSGAQKDLDGYCIHKDVLKHLKSFKTGIVIRKGLSDSVKVLKYNVAHTPCQVTIQHCSLITGKGLIVDQIDQAIEEFKLSPTERITLIPEAMELIRKSFVSKTSGFTIYMNGSKERTLITPNENNYLEMALTMPLIISGEFKKV